MIDIAHLIQSSVAPVFLLSGVAATLGVTVATFDVVLHRSLNALKKALTKSSGDASAEPEAGADLGHSGPRDVRQSRRKETQQ